MRKFKAQSFVLETLSKESSPELLDEEWMLQQVVPDASLEALRLNFFSCLLDAGEWKDLPQRPADADFLGYIVLIQLASPTRDLKPHILESIVRTPAHADMASGGNRQWSSLSNHYFHNVRQFETRIGTPGSEEDYHLVGNFFAQQNGITHVCAHAALRMAVNNSPALQHLGKLTNRIINELHLGKDHLSHFLKTVQPKGLSLDDITKIIRKVGEEDLSGGYEVLVADFREKNSVEYDRYLYPFLESGFPVILEIEGHDNFGMNKPVRHMVSVIGHTMNSDRWGPEARKGYGEFPPVPYISAASWTDHYFVNDDNYGMYLTLPSDMIRNLLVPAKNPNIHAASVTTIIPSQINLTGYAAEATAGSVVKKMLNWARDNTVPKDRSFWLTYTIENCLRPTDDNAISGASELNERTALVFRTLCRTRDQYIEYLDGIRVLERLPGDIKKRIEALSGHVWVTEITLPPLYTVNRHKIGEILIDASQFQVDKDAPFLMAWIPGLVFFQGDPKGHAWPLVDHVELTRLQTSVSERPREW